MLVTATTLKILGCCFAADAFNGTIAFQGNAILGPKIKNWFREYREVNLEVYDKVRKGMSSCP